MNCPNCGAETNEEICPVCGMKLVDTNDAPKAASTPEAVPEEVPAPEAAPADASANEQAAPSEAQAVNTQETSDAAADMNMSQQNPYGAADMNMQQNPYEAPDMNMQQNPYGAADMNMQQNPYGAPDMNGMYQQPGQVYEGKTNAGKIVGVLVGVVVLAVVVIVLLVNLLGGAGKGESIVKNFMDGMAEGDVDKMVEDIDPDSYDDSDIEDMAYTFELLEAWGIEYTVEYDILSTQKADSDIIEEMSEAIYGDEDAGIKTAYIYEVEYTMTMTYDGETDSEDDTMYLMCYKKDGDWYLGGTVEPED